LKVYGKNKQFFSILEVKVIYARTDTNPKFYVINVKKTKFINDGYRRLSCPSKTAKIHRFVIFVMYCFITAVPVAFYWAWSNETVHYKYNDLHRALAIYFRVGTARL